MQRRPAVSFIEQRMPKIFSSFGLLESSSDLSLLRKILYLIGNIFLTPLLLIYHSFRIYLFPCFSSTLVSCLCRTISSEYCCFCCFKYTLHTDKDFGPNMKSIGTIKTQKKIVWKRASEIKTKTAKLNQLFESGIAIDDICQGQLGDCWLLSAIASLSSQPITISNTFISKEFNPRGKYTFRLWDPIASKFVRISIDDYIPVDDSGQPVFVRPHGNEIWVMLLEKVMAKFMGSYGHIEAGYALFGMHILTGQRVRKYTFRNEKWSQTVMEVTKDDKGAYKPSFYLDGSPIETEEMYERIATYSRSQYSQH
jgi:hypothetical protein